MKNMKQLVFLLSILFAICIFYNLCRSDGTNKELKEDFTEFSPLTQENLLQGLEIKPHNEFQNMKTPVGNKALVQYSNNNDDTYYKFSKNINPGHNYKISSWESTTKDWDGKDKLLNIKMYDKGNKIHGCKAS